MPPEPIILPYRGIRPKVADDAFIAPGASVVGDVEIGPRSSLWFGCVARGDMNEIRIGARSNIQDGSVIHVSSRDLGTYIGDEVTVGHMCHIHACTLEDHAFVGSTACVLDGAVVESDALVAAGSLVLGGRRVRSGELWAGRPAQLLRVLTPDEIARNRAVAPRYVGYAMEYLEAGRRTG